MNDAQQQDLVESSHLREVIATQKHTLEQTKAIAHKLLNAYIGALHHGGAVLATYPETNPLIRDAKEVLGIL